ncbi:MAG: hypothetical protein GWO02_07380 [Gammaproteobacteria bacterium]|nr:hypothetical protein [Gammaproteobacteria bacterium]
MDQNPHASSPDRASAPAAAVNGFSLRRLLRAPRTLPSLLPRFLRNDRATRDALDERAELGHDVLAGRVDLARLKGPRAEPYLQGLDVVECRGQRLMAILSVRGRYGRRNPWRLSPHVRAGRRLPDTPAGRRQRAWLDELARAGLIKAGG